MSALSVTVHADETHLSLIRGCVVSTTMTTWPDTPAWTS